MCAGITAGLHTADISVSVRDMSPPIYPRASQPSFCTLSHLPSPNVSAFPWPRRLWTTGLGRESNLDRFIPRSTFQCLLTKCESKFQELKQKASRKEKQQSMKGLLQSVPLKLAPTPKSNPGSPNSYYAHINVSRTLGLCRHCEQHS